MATIIINRPVFTRPTYDTYTAGSDYIRGSGASEILGYKLSSVESFYVNLYSSAFNVSLSSARDDFFVDFDWFEQTGQIRGSYPNFGVPVSPDYTRFLGNDRIYGRDGDDYVVDLFGDNFVVTEEGNDRILLGNGNDRIYDQGGDNDIDILGGNNTVTTRDGNDSITTGDGVDNINAFDGRNIIDAGEGNNIVRGGNDFDDIRVGTGDDFVDVRGGFLGDKDLNGDGIADTGFDENFDGIIDPPDVAQIAFIDPFSGFEFGTTAPAFFHNLVIDNGGSDTILATAPGSRQGDDFILSDVIVDTTVVNGVTQLTLSNIINIGDDLIKAGGGNNFIYDTGGNTDVQTLSGNDTILTSFFFTGDDDIDSGAGTDTINPGAGADVVRAGPGDDFIFLENDGDPDTLVYRAGVNGAVGDEVPASVAGAGLTDIVTGFDIAGGIDKIDMRAFDVDFSDYIPLNAAAFGVSVGEAGFDLLIAWDTNGTGNLDPGDIFTTILADITALPDESNFMFDTMIV